MTWKTKKSEESNDRAWEKEDKRLTRYASHKSVKSLVNFLSQQVPLSAVQTTTGLTDWQTQEDNIIEPATDIPSLANPSTSSTLGYYGNISSPPDLYVKNLDETIDDNKLRELFAEFGTVESCKVMPASDGNRGFVTFSTPQKSYHAFVEMNFKMIGKKPLYVALEPDIEDRRCVLQAKLSQMRPVPVDPSIAPYMPMYPGLRQQIFHHQDSPAMPNLFVPMIQQGGMSNSFVPIVQQGQQSQRSGGTHGGAGQMQQRQQLMPVMPQQTLPKGGRMYQYPLRRNMTEVPMLGVAGGMLSVIY